MFDWLKKLFGGKQEDEQATKIESEDQASPETPETAEEETTEQKQ